MNHLRLCIAFALVFAGSAGAQAPPADGAQAPADGAQAPADDAPAPADDAPMCASPNLVEDGFKGVAESFKAVDEVLAAQNNQLKAETGKISASLAKVAESVLAVNLTVRGNVEVGGILMSRMGDPGEGTLFGTLQGVANQVEALRIGNDDGPGLDAIYEAARKSADGIAKTCPNNCSGGGVCQLGSCMASASETRDGFGSIDADLDAVDQALSQQGELAVLNGQGIQETRAATQAVSANVAAIGASVAALTAAVEQNNALLAQGEQRAAYDAVRRSLFGPTGSIDVAHTVANVEIAIEIVEAQIGALIELSSAVDLNRGQRRQMEGLLQAAAQNLAEAEGHLAAGNRHAALFGVVLGVNNTKKAAEVPLD